MFSASGTTTEDLIALTYQSAFNPDIWHVVCEALSTRFNARIWVGMQGFDYSSGAKLTNFSAGIDREYIDSYVAHFGTINPWMQVVSQGPAGRVQVSEEILPFEDLAKTEMYNDWLKPQEDIGTGAGVTLFREADRFLRVSCNIRLRDRDGLQMQLAGELERLAPHMRYAVEMTRRLAGIPVGTDIQAALEGAACPAFLLDASGRIAHANTLGERQLNEASVARAEKSGLFRLVDPEADRIVQATLADISAGRVEQAKYTIRTRRSNGPPMQVLLTPYDPQGAEQFALLDSLLRERPVALLTLEATPLNAEELQSSLIQAFDLTRTESEIVLALKDGRTLNNIAEERGTSANTVRNQIKSVFGKTGVARQADLIRICADMANPLHSGRASWGGKV